MAEPHPLTDLFNSGADGVFAYRLPSLLAIGQSTLLAFAQGRIGSRQDNAPAAVYLRRSFDAGRSWERGRAIIRNASAAMIAQQALPSGEPGGVILLLNVMPFSVPCGLGKKRCGACVTYMCRSSDNGATWSSLTPLRDVSTHGSGVGNGIVLRSGRLLAPRRADCCDCSGVPRSYVLISDDHGIRWRAGAKLPHGWTESSVAELPNGSVVLTARALHGRSARDHPGKRRLFAISHDAGETWARTWAFSGKDSDGSSVLRDPDCFASLEATTSSSSRASSAPIKAGGALFLAHPSSARRRMNLTIHSSTDGGASWQLWRRVYAGSSAYAALTTLSHGQKLAVAFERDRFKHISLATLHRRRGRRTPRGLQ